MQKVHINVEQTIHRDDGEVETDYSPDASLKTPYLSSVGDKERDALDVIHLA